MFSGYADYGGPEDTFVQSIQGLIVLDKMLFLIQNYWYFSYLSMKTYVVGTHKKLLGEALLRDTYNICFRGQIRKIFTWYPHLSRPMGPSLFTKAWATVKCVNIGQRCTEWFGLSLFTYISKKRVSLVTTLYTRQVFLWYGYCSSIWWRNHSKHNETK